MWRNIWLAFLVKGIVLALGAGGLATMWEAVFADVGVAPAGYSQRGAHSAPGFYQQALTGNC